MIKVLIERHIAAELEDLYQKTARETLRTAMQSHGFISGESLKDRNRPSHRYIIATYQNLTDWERWYHSEERLDLMNTINPLLAEDEKITILEHV